MITLKYLRAENFKGLRSVYLRFPEQGSVLIDEVDPLLGGTRTWKSSPGSCEVDPLSETAGTWKLSKENAQGSSDGISTFHPTSSCWMEEAELGDEALFSAKRPRRMKTCLTETRETI